MPFSVLRNCAIKAKIYMFKTKMTLIYCLKCKAKTDSKSESYEVTSNDQNRLTAICIKCGKKKGVFVGTDGNYKSKNQRELATARIKRKETALNRRARKIGREIIDNDAQKCVKKCLAQMQENN
jgi:site-specific DNA-adenine methylase